MIGDVLCDAIRNLERYQREMPDSYDDMRDEIEACKNAMRKLRRNSTFHLTRWTHSPPSP